MANRQDEKGAESGAVDGRDPHLYAPCCRGGFYEIHVKCHLNSKWSDWLEGLDARLLDNGEMILSGHIVDQAALIGILNKLNRLNVALLSVNEVDQEE